MWPKVDLSTGLLDRLDRLSEWNDKRALSVLVRKIKIKGKENQMNETRNVEKMILKWLQSKEFDEEIYSLKKERAISSTSHLRSFDPRLDEND